VESSDARWIVGHTTSGGVKRSGQALKVSIHRCQGITVTTSDPQDKLGAVYLLNHTGLLLIDRKAMYLVTVD
jgi:hypothetical protein